MRIHCEVPGVEIGVRILCRRHPSPLPLPHALELDGCRFTIEALCQECRKCAGLMMILCELQHLRRNLAHVHVLYPEEKA